MQRWIVMAVVVVTALIVLPSVASDEVEDRNGQWCPIQGTFVGESPDWGLRWTLINSPHTNHAGSLLLQFLGGDPTFGGYFPNVVGWSDTKGTWQRTGTRSWDFTMIHYGLDAAGQPVYVTKMSGTNTFPEDCGEVTVEGTFAIYDATQDPLGDEPPAYGCYPAGVSVARRLTVAAPCTP